MWYYSNFDVGRIHGNKSSDEGCPMSVYYPNEH